MMKAGTSSSLLHTPSSQLGNGNGDNAQPNNEPDNQQQSLEPLTPAITTPPSFPYTLPQDVEPTPEAAECYFQIFRIKHLSLLPIVHFKQDMTSKKLRQERPFLWLCIIAVSSTNMTKHNTLAQAVREIAARQIIIEGERSMDLLLGLLCFIAWGHFRFSMGPLLSVFSHLCTALTLDLELHSHPGESIMNKLFPGSMPPNFHGKIRVPKERSNEHRRTALACYFITSSAATFHSRVESLSWSAYLDDCLKALEHTKEAPGDEVLVYLVKLQLIASKATTVRVQIGDVESEQSTRLIGPYVSSLNSQLASIKSQMPAHLVTNNVVQAMAFHTEITINELALLRVQHVLLSTDTDTQTMDSLLMCLAAVKSWLDTIIKFDGTDYIGFNFPLWKQFRTIVLVLIRMAVLEDPAWDVNLVRRTVNLPAVLDHIVSNLGNLVELEHGEENVYSKSVKLLNGLKSWSLLVYNQVETQTCSILPEHVSNESFDDIQPQGVEQQMQSQNMDGFPSFGQDFWDADLFGWWPDLHSE
ncbi:hypothetical protein ASPWEDRAFT_134843 [Aspergillus wentii DTO 134E9]|uniref:Transcription factor domain-containing protein n=1 Tax=Aspergillus wentii DTO 134E9 TaxID=1073089 RepID=A0A1L9RMI8_ASPWE|nr:uncharacterized protein ASPWEDRAFT_134843 [Aspergillus wentii DTO 134E9]OJJ36146.1 hypothetical protein ASPWEDRAFT_134843 [Aspergillus wentii DTO 134E9]